jgi:hypothetical protein
MLIDGINKEVAFNRAAIKDAIFGSTSIVTDQETGATISLFEGSSADEGEYQEINVSDGIDEHLIYNIDEFNDAFKDFADMVDRLSDVEGLFC